MGAKNAKVWGKLGEKRLFFHRNCDGCVKKREKAWLSLLLSEAARRTFVKKAGGVRADCAEVSGKPIEKLKKSDIMKV